MGNWNASTNTPTLSAPNIDRANQVWYVDVAGTQFGIDFGVGDELVYNVDGGIFKRDATDIPALSPSKITQMPYFNYAGSVYGDKYSLLANAWQDMENSETVLFDIPLALAAPNQEMGGMTIDLYVGTNGQLQALYDACVNGTIPPPIDSATRDVYYVNDVATYYVGDGSGDVGFPIPLYVFGHFLAGENTSFAISDLTPLGMGLGLVLAKIVNVPIPNNNIVIQQGFEFENENGIIIPESVTSIGDWAFYNWTSNNQPLVIPNSVTSIGNYAFYRWTSNNQPLVIPNSVTSIGDQAFQYWSSNNQPLVIPNSVTSIGVDAFSGWPLVPYVEIQAITPPALASSNAFNVQNNAPIYVPDESVTAYKTATNWVNLASRIFPISDNSYYNKTEINTMIGDIESALDAILGV